MAEIAPEVNKWVKKLLNFVCNISEIEKNWNTNKKKLVKTKLRFDRFEIVSVSWRNNRE